MKIGLVLEGGGMRGLYTIGVLDALMEENIWVDYVIGVSAGACNGASYLSRQKGRSLQINSDFIGSKDYLSVQNFIKTGSMFGMKLLFDTIPNQLLPYDYDMAMENPCEFVTGVTDVQTGQAVYFDKSHHKKGKRCRVLEASSAIPGFSPQVKYRGKYYVDGGVTAPIPIEKALEDGCDRVIVVLTRERDFVKPSEPMRPIYKKLYRDNPWMIAALDRRHQVYNKEKALCLQLEQEGRAIVIAPKESLGFSRFEKDKEKLMAGYAAGMQDVADRLEALHSFTAKP